MDGFACSWDSGAKEISLDDIGLYDPRQPVFARGVQFATPIPGVLGQKSPPENKGSSMLRVVHTFKPVNSYAISIRIPYAPSEEVLATVIKPAQRINFCSDAANGYWAITHMDEDRNKTASSPEIGNDYM